MAMLTGGYRAVKDVVKNHLPIWKDEEIEIRSLIKVEKFFQEICQFYECLPINELVLLLLKASFRGN